MREDKTPDYYEILQVHFLAEPEIIKAAYKRLAAKYHPDVNKYPEAEAIMKRINIAYSVLSDPAKRAEYDGNYKQKSNGRDGQEAKNEQNGSSREAMGDEIKSGNNHSYGDNKETTVKKSAFRLGLAHYVLIFIGIGVILFLLAFNISDEEKLFKAIEKGDTLTISRLADKDPNLVKYGKNKEGKSPLEYAADMEQLDAAKLLREKGAEYSVNNEAFFKAVKDGDIKQVKRFIAFGADVNVTTDVTINGNEIKGLTPLHRAVYEGQTAVAELLVSKGADVDAKISGGATALHWAVANNQITTVELLISKGADVNAKSLTGWTPLHAAAADGQTATVELLISKGADVNAKANDWGTPLCLAFEFDHKATAELIVKNGADVNVKGLNERMPLHWAALRGNTNMVELLISKGADVNVKDNLGGTPLHWAVTNGQTDTANLLRRHGGHE